ncbi:MAG: single-stranded-DNA-specific exonuclease RecJ [Betaproteobacteria bacterium]|nr:single-stranded-DNA-specific exonuclease RecJ [Betaproteobacteria bacterium]MSQ88613.1 single-stranded-DNA-specific exonuclease RecJ [Betaproteobacteria bacterium]
MKIVTRRYAEADRNRLLESGVHPLLARLYAARRIGAKDQLEQDFSRLISPTELTNADRAASLLADAIAQQKKLLIVADYDADGATACAVGMRALRSFGARVEYLVPNRLELGYGLSPELVAIAAQREPDLLITVDNGIASVEGVAYANSLGIGTLITDHHLPGDTLPNAECIVNPNQPGCTFPSKALAGVGVMFYVMLALRAELRNRQAFANHDQPKLAALTDLVALGTVADVVPLDANNRILVAQGLKRLRAGQGQAGLAALARAGGRDTAHANCFDLGFILGPRLNAAGRLADMGLGIECLLTDDAARAANCAQELDRLNRERRKIESSMLEQANVALDDLLGPVGETLTSASCTLYQPGWHQGVVGLIASRVRERVHRPTLCFAQAKNGELRGSGRSIPGFHLRDALDLVSKRAPGLLLRFGGHAQAAGLTIRESDLGLFQDLFESTAAELLPEAARLRVVETDGELEPAYRSLAVAQMLESQIWGQGFPPPLFCDTFAVESQRVVGGHHLKLRLRKDGQRLEAMRFNSLEPMPALVRAAYRLSVNEFNGLKTVQLNLESHEPT